MAGGGSWIRKEGALAKKYIIETQKTGNSINAIKLNGFNTQETFNQTIRKDIWDYYQKQKCVMLGIKGESINTKIEVDHKDGRKDDWRVSDKNTQTFDDFQPLCKAANDVKRQICKQCKQTNKRWDAKNIKGNPYSFYLGDENYNKDIGCKGCYQYDPVEYRKTCTKKICNETSKCTADYIMKKLYPEE